jgi:hypothetical protein
LHFAVSAGGILVIACIGSSRGAWQVRRPAAIVCDSEETFRHEPIHPIRLAPGRSLSMIRARLRLPALGPDTRPGPTTRLEAEIRQFWDAAIALAGFGMGAVDPGRRMALPAAIASLTELATSHASHRLRRAAADRLMSFVPETAARLMRRRSAASRTGR